MIGITHHGATTGVTDSCYELIVGNSGVLIDCGLFQGEEKDHGANATDLAIDFPIEHINALIVTHVHIEHVGRIPYLLAAGFDGPIICSEPCVIMLPEILEDALKIGFTRDRALIERVLGLIRSRLVPVPYGQRHSVFEQSNAARQVRLQRAGHILGSAYVECDARSGTARERIVFSGDLGAEHASLLPEPQPSEKADRLVIERTYGDRDHEDREARSCPGPIWKLLSIRRWRPSSPVSMTTFAHFGMKKLQSWCAKVAKRALKNRFQGLGLTGIMIPQ